MQATRGNVGRRILICWIAGLVAAAGFVSAMAQTLEPLMESEIKAANGRQLRIGDLRSLLVGSTIYTIFLKAAGNVPVGTTSVVYHRDERTRIIGLSQGRKAEAVWWFEGDTYCNEQRTVNPGNRCYSAWELSGTTYFCLQPSGDCFLSVRVVPGNPESL